jgi:Mor family transcriptional regulator
VSRLQADIFDAMTCDPLDLVERLDQVGATDCAWPQTLADIVAVFAAHRRRQGLSDEAALTDAQELAVLLAEYLGGRRHYLPRGEQLRRALRDQQIYMQMGRMPVSQIAQTHGITETQVYAIHAEQRKLFLRRRQGRLFEEG